MRLFEAADELFAEYRNELLRVLLHKFLLIRRSVGDQSRDRYEDLNRATAYPSGVLQEKIILCIESDAQNPQ